MKTFIRLLTLAAVATFFALPAFAQDTAAAPADPCATAGEDELYKKYYDEKNTKKDQAAAFETAKQYLAKYPNCSDRYTANVKKFHDAYAAAVTAVNEEKDFYIALYGSDANKTGRNVGKAYEIGRRLLAKNPEDLSVLMQLGYAGYTDWANKNPAFAADSATNLVKAIRLIEGGKSIDKWTPFNNRDEALSYLNFAAGDLLIKDRPTEALPFYLKAAALEGPMKKDALTYARLGAIYYLTQYEPMQKDFTAKYAGKEETPESKAALDNLNQVVDRIVDAYARAINLAGSDQRFAATKAEWLTQVTELYKFRHEGKTDGLDAYIAGITATPLPEPFRPSAAPAATTPANGNNGTTPTATAEKKP
jgi:hypothetical protein